MSKHESISDLLKKQVDIVDLAQNYLSIELNKRGSNYVGLCPLHTEKSPSFTIYPNTNSFKCFGCQKGGDIISLVQEIKGYSFKETSTWIANKFNIPIHKQSMNTKSQKEKDIEELYLVNKWAMDFFHENLNKESNDLLENKNINPESINKFKIGYAQHGSKLLNTAKAQGFKEEILFKAGLIGKNENGDYYDFFRNRVMFPIREKYGKVIGFSGRSLGNSGAKYINTKETLIYKKHKILYGIYECNNEYSTTKKDNIIVVEGYTDVIAAHQDQLTNTVASCGTSFSNHHIEYISQYTKNITLVFDGDDPGKKAAEKSISTIFEIGCFANIVLLPVGKDPNDLIIEHESLKDYIKSNRMDAISYTLKQSLKNAVTALEISNAIKNSASLIALIKDELCRDTYISSLSKENKIGKKIFVKSVNEIIAKAQKTEIKTKSKTPFDFTKHQHIKVVDNYYAIIPKLSSYDNKSFYAELVPRKPTELKREYSEAYLRSIPRFDGIVSEPDHFNLKSSIEITFQGHTYEKINWYHKLPKQPKAFKLPPNWDEGSNYNIADFPEIQTTLKYLKHTGGDFWIHLIDYLSILLVHPKRHLPALCLVSKEKGTGKSTMISLLRVIFGENAANADVRRLASNFNKFMLGKLLIMVEETRDERGEIQETLKSYITGREIQVEGKGQEPINVPSFIKFVFCSNYPETFLKGGDDDRFFVLEVPKIEEGKKDNQLLEKMIQEVPHFLYFLKERKIRYPDKGRLWFDRIPTTALEKLKNASEPIIIQSLKELLHTLFSNKLKDENGSLVKEIKLSSQLISLYLNKFNSTRQHQPNKVTRDLNSMGFKNSGSSTRFKYPAFDSSIMEIWQVEWKTIAGRYYKFRILDYLTPSDIRSIYSKKEISSLFSVAEIKDFGLLPVQLDIKHIAASESES